jgi:hypothetical protein
MHVARQKAGESVFPGFFIMAGVEEKGKGSLMPRISNGMYSCPIN